MKSTYAIFCILLLTLAKGLIAQVPTRIVAGRLLLDDGSTVLRVEKYRRQVDSLDIRLKQNPKDTSVLFQRALFYDLMNNILSQPDPEDKKSLDNLLLAKRLVDTAAVQGMDQLKFQVLRAQICIDLVYRYSVNESWRFSQPQIAERMKLKKFYSDLASQYYSHLAIVDKTNAYDYQRLNPVQKTN